MSPSGRSRESVRKPVDRRSSRTRASIDKAFLALLKNRGYDAVGVSDIVREADVGRATFYEHYTSKDDLLRAQLRHVLESMLCVRPDEADFVDATPLFAHVRAVPLLYRLVAGRSAAARSLRVMQGVLEERMEAIVLERRGAGAAPPGPLTAELSARVLVASLCALLAWWTEQGMAATPEEMQQLFRVCAQPLLAGGPAS